MKWSPFIAKRPLRTAREKAVLKKKGIGIRNTNWKALQPSTGRSFPLVLLLLVPCPPPCYCCKRVRSPGSNVTPPSPPGPLHPGSPPPAPGRHPAPHPAPGPAGGAAAVRQVHHPQGEGLELPRFTVPPSSSPLTAVVTASWSGDHSAAPVCDSTWLLSLSFALEPSLCSCF